MQCPNCFSNIPDGSSICPICKKSFSQPSGSPNSSLYPDWQNQISQPQPQPYPPQPRPYPPQPQPYPPQPQPYPPQPQPYPPQPYPTIDAAALDGKKRKLMIWSMVSLLLVCLPVGIYGLVKYSSISKIADPAEAAGVADRATKTVITWSVALYALSFILGFLIALA